MSEERIPTLEQAKEYIYSMDFSDIINKLVVHQGWSRKEAEDLCQIYRNFLYLNKKYDNEGPLPPSEELDEFWHAHILDTKKYRQDTMAIFGRYFDHYPYFGIDGNTDLSDLNTAFEKTKMLYEQEFAEPFENVRFHLVFRWILKILLPITALFRQANQNKSRNYSK